MWMLYTMHGISPTFFLLIGFVGSFTTKMVSFKIFWEFNSISPFSFFLSFKPSYILLPALLHIHSLFYFPPIIICICVYIYIPICIHSRIFLFSQYNVSCKYVFRADYLPNVS